MCEFARNSVPFRTESTRTGDPLFWAREIERPVAGWQLRWPGSSHRSSSSSAYVLVDRREQANSANSNQHDAFPKIWAVEQAYISTRLGELSPGIRSNFERYCSGQLASRISRFSRNLAHSGFDTFETLSRRFGSEDRSGLADSEIRDDLSSYMYSTVFAFPIIRTAIAPLWVPGPFRLARLRVPRRPELLPKNVREMTSIPT